MPRAKTPDEIIDSIESRNNSRSKDQQAANANYEQESLSNIWQVQNSTTGMINLSCNLKDDFSNNDVELFLGIRERNLKTHLKIQFCHQPSQNKLLFPQLMMSIYSPAAGSLNKLPLKVVKGNRDNLFGLNDRLLQKELLPFFLHKEPIFIEIWMDYMLPTQLKRVAQFKFGAIPEELLIPVGYRIDDSDESREPLYFNLIQHLSDQNNWDLTVNDEHLFAQRLGEGLSIVFSIGEVLISSKTKDMHSNIHKLIESYPLRLSSLSDVSDKQSRLSSDNMCKLMIDVLRLVELIDNEGYTDGTS